MRPSWPRGTTNHIIFRVGCFIGKAVDTYSTGKGKEKETVCILVCERERKKDLYAYIIYSIGR